MSSSVEDNESSNELNENFTGAFEEELLNTENESSNELNENFTGAFEEELLNTELETYVFRLYVANTTPKSLRAIEKIKNICQEHLAGRYKLEIIDIYKHPELLEEEQIVVVPTLIKKLPLPLQKFIGDLTNTERLLLGLDIWPYS